MFRKRKSRLSQAKQYRLMEHFVAGTTARCAAALVAANSKTAVYYLHRLREIICYHLELEADGVANGTTQSLERLQPLRLQVRINPRREQSLSARA